MGLFVFVIAGIAINQALSAPGIGIDSFGSGTAPMGVAIALVFLAAIMVFQEIRSSKKDGEGASANLEPLDLAAVPAFLKGILLAGALASYVILLEITDIPFWFVTVIFLAISAWIIEGHLRKWLVPSIITSLVLAASIEIIFTRILLISLP